MMVLLTATAVSAAPYFGGSYGSEYTRSSSTEQVSVSESEYHRSTNNACGYGYCHSTGSYDYGRSRDFSFSRSENYENSRSYVNSNYGGYPTGYATYGNSRYQYPYYDVGTSYGRDYRPFSEYYTQSRNSPYYNPYQYSRVGAYSGYRPYGY